MFMVMLKKGAGIEGRGLNWSTPLHKALIRSPQQCNWGSDSKETEKGADANARANAGYSAISSYARLE